MSKKKTKTGKNSLRKTIECLLTFNGSFPVVYVNIPKHGEQLIQKVQTNRKNTNL